VERLFIVLRGLRDQELGIIFVSHFLEQVYAVSDRITVLRNGRMVGTWESSNLSRSALILAMTGRDASSFAGSDSALAVHQHDPDANSVMLEVDGLVGKPLTSPVTLRVRAGEAMGIAGLLGSGRSELLHLLFGDLSPERGVVRIDGKVLGGGSIVEAIAAGMALVPEDRKRQGLFLDLSVRENILLALQARRGALRPIARSEASHLVEHFIRMLDIRTPSPETPVGLLSGGNQQKVLLARWLATAPRVLLLDEPARGVDVGARHQIEALVASLRAQGLAILLVSSELDELVRTCTSATVLRDRSQAATLRDAPLTEAAMLKAIVGDERKVFA
jgi:simple sugar transport system ATP-binding protein